MGTTDDTGKAIPPSTASGTAEGAAMAAAGEQPFGPNAASILATEHWSLLGTRSLIWGEAMSRATVFLTVLSASIIALALLSDATGFGPHITTLALGPEPVGDRREAFSQTTADAETCRDDRAGRLAPDRPVRRFRPPLVVNPPLPGRDFDGTNASTADHSPAGRSAGGSRCVMPR